MTELVFFFAVLRGTHDEEADEVPEQDCDHNAVQDRRDLFMVLGD
jgi:hypothetical protein